MRHGRAVRGDNCDHFGNFDDLGVKMNKKYAHNMTHQVRHGRAVGGALQSCEYPSDVFLQMSCEVVKFSRCYLVDAVCISYYIFPQMPCEAENVNIPVPLGLAYRPQTHSCDWPDLLTGNILGHM